MKDIMRILIVEDEKSLADIVKKGLEEEGYVVDVAYNGEDGLFMAENEPSDLIILDIMLPIIDGMTILKRIRKAGVKTPVLMLTAKDTIMDKVSGLVAAMWKVIVDKEPKSEAGKQLSILYGHLPIGKTTATDHFFENWTPPLN